MSTFADVWAVASTIDGWLTEGQARVLFDAAAACPAGGTIVEIGSFQGRSTVVLARACPPDAVVVAIDPHAGNDRGPQEIIGFGEEAADDHDAFVGNLELAMVTAKVRHIREFSDRALSLAPDEIDVLYVDGAHRFGPARADIRSYGQRVSESGTMLIHDSFSSVGVTLAILRELLLSRRWEYQRRSRSLAVYTSNAGVHRAKNAGRQVLQLPWFVRNLAIKVGLTLGLGALVERTGRTAPTWPY